MRGEGGERWRKREGRDGGRGVRGDGGGGVREDNYHRNASSGVTQRYQPTN